MAAAERFPAGGDPVGRPHGRGRRPPLTRRDVMVRALELIDVEGVDALSLRRLAQALDRSPMALYRHAESKGDLLDGVVELLLEQVVLDADAPDWQDELRRVAHRFRSLALAHPNAVPLLVARSVSTPLGLRPLGMLRPLEAFLQLAARAGLDDAASVAACRSFFGLLHGHVLDELQVVVAHPEESEDLLRLGLHRLPLGEFPRMRSLASEMSAYDGAAQLDRFLEVLLVLLAVDASQGG